MARHSKSPNLLREPEGMLRRAINDPVYWQALGRFIEAYAITESMMFHLLVLYCRILPDIGKAIFSGTRLDASIKLIRRIMAAIDVSDERNKELERVFAQLLLINEVRNDVIHYGSHETLNSGRISSNFTRAHVPENIIVRPMSSDVLDAMTGDLEMITSLLFVHVGLNDEESIKARTVRPHSVAWRYRPPPSHEMKLNKPERRDRPR